MKKILFFLSGLLLCSCNFIDKKVPVKEQLLNERLQEIDWNELTRYPSVTICDSIADKVSHRDCFFDYMTQSLQERLAIDTLSILYPEIDSIHLKVIVNPDGSIEFEPHKLEDLSYDAVKLDSIIKSRLQYFPNVESAQKEGIPVKSEFLIPIILKIE